MQTHDKYEEAILNKLRSISKRNLPKLAHIIDLIAIDFTEGKSNKTKQYDFSDICGKLNWKKDPVKEQRKIRDAW